ncbi:MAG: hypothetical protein ACWGQW_09475, partial [bacterium]
DSRFEIWGLVIGDREAGASGLDILPELAWGPSLLCKRLCRESLLFHHLGTSPVAGSLGETV